MGIRTWLSGAVSASLERLVLLTLHYATQKQLHQKCSNGKPMINKLAWTAVWGTCNKALVTMCRRHCHAIANTAANSS